jgi:hypothetical protein
MLTKAKEWTLFVVLSFIIGILRINSYFKVRYLSKTKDYPLVLKINGLSPVPLNPHHYYVDNTPYAFGSWGVGYQWFERKGVIGKDLAWERIDIEEVLTGSPKEVQKELVFNLDLLL